jgi:hypothetical protein
MLKLLVSLIALVALISTKEVAAQARQPVPEDSIFNQYVAPISTGYNAARPYYVGRWSGELPSTVKIIRPLDAHIAIIYIADRKSFDVLVPRVKLSGANDAWKLPMTLHQLSKKANELRKFNVCGLDIDSLLAVLQRNSEVNILSVHRSSNCVTISCKSKLITQRILSMKEVIFIDIVAEAHPETNIIGYDRSFHGINAVDYHIPGANGKNIVVGVKEQKPDENDIDLWKRVLPSSIAATTTSYHATVIASIIGGAGNSSYYGRGIAWGCSFFPSTFSNLFADDAGILSANRVAVQNHSYGTVIQQFYGAEAVSYDVLTWNNRYYLPVMSAGNQGASSATDGRYASLPGYANLTGNFKMAKNVITVGAIDNKDIIPLLSSAGPAYDGRLAPQLIALGPSGTSDATGIVSGTIAVMQQVYADSNGNALPPASLIKAVLFNTAEDIYRTGIDYKTGYGLLNSYAAIRGIQQKKYDGGVLANGQQWTKSIPVPPNTAELKVTLAWTDTAAAVNNNKALVNDLDLEVVEMPGGSVYKPWVLSAVADTDSLSFPAVRKRDSLNTAEQVSIRLPNAGTYQVRVKGTAVNTTSLPFHISYTTDTLNTFAFTSPLHASDVNREENASLNIRWRTFIADTTQTGNLYISYNNGGSWQSLAQPVKLVARKFQWQVKDTNAIAMLKMETGFGTFLSGSFIVGKWTRLSVDFNCADSFRLSWNKHIDAASYRLYALSDSPYLKHVITVTDTAVVMQKSLSPSAVYAVEPVLNSGIPAARSQALDIRLQGVYCFYKTLNYDLLDSNKLRLILELSISNYTDSISFEMVGADGRLLHSYGSIKTSSSNLIYSQVIVDLPGGALYFRARIRLQNGTIIYTNVISVITSGKRYISFYPNPAGRNTRIKSVFMQGLSPDSKLCLYDVYGRLLRWYAFIPDQIDISRLQAGMIIYRLLDEQDRTLETGKIIIY